MVELNIKLHDEKFRKDFDALQEVIPDMNEKALGHAAAFVRGRVQKDYLRGPRPERLEVRSGRLIGSIQSAVVREGKVSKAFVGSNAVSKKGFNYPGYWENDPVFPDRKRDPRPFLNPAVEDNADKWVTVWINNLKKRIEAWLSARAS
jgi:hypothetical protein